MMNLAYNANNRTQMGSLVDLFKQATDLYNANASVLDPIRNNAISSAVQSVSPSKPSVVPQTQVATQVQQPVSSGMSTGAKIGLGVAGVALVSGIIYAVTKKKK